MVPAAGIEPATSRLQGGCSTVELRRLTDNLAAADVLAEARILRIGRRLAVGEVVMHTSGDPRPVRHATGTYVIPPAHGSR